MHYEFNDAAKEIAARLIEEFHPHLSDVKIAYIWKGNEEDRVPVPSKAGKAVEYAKASLLPEKYRLLADQDYRFVIEFCRPIWDNLSLDAQEALIDHELTHCRVEQLSGECYMADHDLEEFRSVLTRRGFYRESIRLFVEAAQPLFDQPGIQQRFVTPPVGDVAVCAGQVIRVEETGETWTYSVKDGGFIKVAGETTITLTVPGMEPVTATQGQMEAALKALKGRKSSASEAEA